jgi:uncharacterized membrane protein (GlpM family)
MTIQMLFSADPQFWFELALKMAMTAAIVVVASVAVERSGPFIGALIAALPTAAGAAYIILAIEHLPAFIAASALGSLATGAAVSIFALSYTMLAQRHGLVLSLSVATLLWFGVAAALRQVAWTPLSATLVVAAVFAFTIPLSRRYRTSGAPPRFLRKRLDLPLRALTAAIVVAIVTTASHRIGSFASGMFALFPIVLGSFIVILHPRVGGRAAASVLAHAQVPFIGLGLGFLAVYFLAEPLGSWWALAIGLAICIAWNGMLWWLRARKTKM